MLLIEVAILTNTYNVKVKCLPVVLRVCSVRNQLQKGTIHKCLTNLRLVIYVIQHSVCVSSA